MNTRLAFRWVFNADVGVKIFYKIDFICEIESNIDILPNVGSDYLKKICIFKWNLINSLIAIGFCFSFSAKAHLCEDYFSKSYYWVQIHSSSTGQPKDFIDKIKEYSIKNIDPSNSSPFVYAYIDSDSMALLKSIQGVRAVIKMDSFLEEDVFSSQVNLNQNSEPKQKMAYFKKPFFLNILDQLENIRAAGFSKKQTHDLAMEQLFLLFNEFNLHEITDKDVSYFFETYMSDQETVSDALNIFFSEYKN